MKPIHFFLDRTPVRLSGVFLSLILCLLSTSKATAQDPPYQFATVVTVHMFATADASSQTSDFDLKTQILDSSESNFDGGTITVRAANSNEHGSVSALGRVNYALTETSGFMIYRDEVRIQQTDSYPFPGLGGRASAGVMPSISGIPGAGNFDVHVRRSDTGPITYQNGLGLNLFYSGLPYHIMWSINDAPYPGQTPDGPNKSGDGPDESDGDIGGDYMDGCGPGVTEDLEAGVSCKAKNKTTADDLYSNARPEDHLGAGLVAAITDGPVDSRYIQHHYSAPVVDDIYGTWSDPNDQGTYQPTYFGNPSIISADDTPAVGYLFMDNGGGDFTSFTIPTALAGGDDAFVLVHEEVAYDMNAGDVFNFLEETGVDSVDSFLLFGIDETEMIDGSAEVPFVFGITSSLASSYTDFVAVPLVEQLPGDFTSDGRVDGRDFLAWQRGESLYPLHTGELAAWQANYGPESSPENIATIPEPTGGLLLVVATISVLTRQRAVKLPE